MGFRARVLDRSGGSGGWALPAEPTGSSTASGQSTNGGAAPGSSTAGPAQAAPRSSAAEHPVHGRTRSHSGIHKPLQPKDGTVLYEKNILNMDLFVPQVSRKVYKKH